MGGVQALQQPWRKLRRGLLRRWPVAFAPANCIIMNDVLHHIPHDRQIPLLKRGIPIRIYSMCAPSPPAEGRKCARRLQRQAGADECSVKAKAPQG